MPSIRKRKRSPAALNPPLVTPHTSESRACNAARTLRQPSTISTSSFQPPASFPITSQLRTPFPSANSPPGLDETESFIDDDLGHVIAAIDMKDSGTVGCAYYSAEEEKMYLLRDIRLGGMEKIEDLLLRIQPTVMLTSSRVDISDLQGHRQNIAQDNDSSSYLPYQVDIRPTTDFSFVGAQNRLVGLEISSSHEDRIRFFVPQSGLTGPEEMNPQEMGFTLNEGRLLYMSSSIDMENPVTIGCAGAILTHLQRRRGTGTIIGVLDDSPFKVRHLEMFSLEDMMGIDNNTLWSLQIIHPESHPSIFNQGPGTKSASGKEGLSVYGLFHRFASTPQGKAKLKQIFFRPSLDIAVIRDRHDFISVFSRPDNLVPLEKMTKALKHVRNLRLVMTNLRKGISTGSAKITGFAATVWASLLAFAFYSIDIHDGLREISGAESLSLRAKALQLFEAAQLYRVGKMIQEIVDIDSSEEQGRTVVKQGLDRDLDRMKDRYDGLSSLLKRVAIEIATTIPEELDIDVNVIYFPQLGFNIAIPLNDRGQAQYSNAHENWEIVFVTETRAYFKDFRMRELDNKLGDIYGLICEKEIEIVYDLAQRILHYENVLVEASDVCGDLDSHILQELTISSYVPNNTLLMGGPETQRTNTIASQTGSAPSMLVLTGPNYSGKSVYMKQVALIVYLAQIGSFIPAEEAELGITDKILTKMNTQESVSKIQSTFMSDLQQMSLCLKQATGRSLVLIDEFGKGTNESDGIGLACGILEHLLCLEDAPKVIAATHFHEIFENDFLPSRSRLQLGHMEVKVCEESQDVEDQVIYLYNFHPGRCNKSFGTICAAINGVEAAIVDRANEIALLAARGENLIAACAILSEEETKALQEAQEIY
ncbi:DNA mismatch repair protein MutS core [Penicillium macrosclerotiorum]|uniref:DNA mismatch repair protein MutS core n=1 Tax=Penicillium macrosclerotiorum TaxID=303699 RepID=UPI00254766BE|nr:DNA mismatch repair protein MutS core [Penicillium macrosclerotiorum]KAJ5682222.1 DNA mismatch repair protein MutS core [Penicillium macrosclerotiorum]